MPTPIADAVRYVVANDAPDERFAIYTDFDPAKLRFKNETRLTNACFSNRPSRPDDRDAFIMLQRERRASLPRDRNLWVLIEAEFP